MVKLVTQPFLTEDAYVQAVGAPRRTLRAAGRVEGPPPFVFPATDATFYGAEPVAYDFPAVTVTTLRDAVVRGKSNMATTPEAILRHGLIQLGPETPPELFYGRLRVTEDRTGAAWGPDDPFAATYLPEAAGFLDGVAFNYAHWMTEVLPRIAAFIADAGLPAVPLIVDYDLHPNIVRSLELVVGPDTVIHRLRAGEVVRVGVLHNVSPTGYVPFKVAPQPVERICQGVFNPSALRDSVQTLRRAIDSAGEARPRLFLRRKSSVRHVPNEAEIEAALEALGFVAVEPEGLTLDEQVRVYGQAEMIVGATGAAIANVIFCRPDCPTVVFIPRFRATAVWYWRQMAAAAGAGPVLHVSGRQLEPTEDPFDALAVHRDFRVEVQDVLDAVEAAEALRR